MIASGVFVAGSFGLSVGSRYGIQLDGAQLRVLGPVHLDPSTVALEHELAGMNASGEGERLVISHARSGKTGLVLVFMSLSGGSSASVAAAIAEAGHAAEAVSR